MRASGQFQPASSTTFIPVTHPESIDATRMPGRPEPLPRAGSLPRESVAQSASSLVAAVPDVSSLRTQHHGSCVNEVESLLVEYYRTLIEYTAEPSDELGRLKHEQWEEVKRVAMEQCRQGTDGDSEAPIERMRAAVESMSTPDLMAMQDLIRADIRQFAQLPGPSGYSLGIRAALTHRSPEAKALAERIRTPGYEPSSLFDVLLRIGEHAVATTGFACEFVNGLNRDEVTPFRKSLEKVRGVVFGPGSSSGNGRHINRNDTEPVVLQNVAFILDELIEAAKNREEAARQNANRWKNYGTFG